jgi:UDP-N-acetyl-D-mannosaminuronic acid dehydrogenase
MEKVAIIGLGRVGIPLCLFMDNLGFSVIGIDRDDNVINSLRKKKMPFFEEGCDELISKTKVQFVNDIKYASNVDYIIITVGTPLLNNIETDLSGVFEVVKSLLNILKKGHSIILRSTVAPETTTFIKKYIELNTDLIVGKDLSLSFCPERLAENHALEELKTLPQVIGSEDDLSISRSENLFKSFDVKIFHTTYVSAELVKLFNNNARYVNFAVANQFAIIANDFGQNIYEIIGMCNEDYPRGHIFGPGLTAGTCLRKDFGMINERSHGTDVLLSAWKVNEYMPYHIVNNVSNYCDLYRKKISILGYTFKKNSDDTRDTLVPKLIRYVERKVPDTITICEPHLDTMTIQGYPNKSLEEALSNADVVFIAMNHDVFSNAHEICNSIKNGSWVVDIWNCLGRNEFLFQNNT